MFLRCSSDNQYEVTATLTGCSDEQFTCRKDLTLFLKLKKYLTEKNYFGLCREGFCVTMEQRCDGVVHCRDKSDEVTVDLCSHALSFYTCFRFSVNYVPSVYDGACLGWV